MKKNLMKTLALSLALTLAAVSIPASLETAFAENSDFITSNAASLEKVTSLKAKDRDNDEVELSWTPVKGASGYEISRYSVKDGKWILLGRSDDSDFDAEHLLSATAYSFRVRAFANNSSGNVVYGAWSSTYKTCTRPNDVKNLRTSSKTDSSVTLKWDSVKRADGYQVYQYDSVSGQWERLINTGKISYKITNLEPGVSYKFRIRPYRNALNSRYYGEYEAITVKTSSSSTASDVISTAQAKNIALADAGVSASSLSFINVSLDMDDGIKVYEIEFTAGDWEYEYEILAATGKIRDRDKDSIWD